MSLVLLKSLIMIEWLLACGACSGLRLRPLARRHDTFWNMMWIFDVDVEFELIESIPTMHIACSIALAGLTHTHTLTLTHLQHITCCNL